MGNILEVKGLVCGYTNDAVLKGVSFQLQKAEFMAIIGPNGSGKTTLIRALTRVIKPWQGKILFEGRDIQSIARIHLAQKVSVLPQFTDIPFSFSVEEVVLMGRFAHLGLLKPITSNDINITKLCMQYVGVWHLRDKRINELSGGERQLVYLAQALAQQPILLLLDEPTSHLDIGHQIKILNLVKRLNLEKGVSILASMHDLNLASQYCQKLILLNEGGIEKIGTPEEVLEKEILQKVYKTEVIIARHPVFNTPYVYIGGSEGH